MAELTRQGRETINDWIENQLAPSIQEKWKGNLLDSQQSLTQDIKTFTDNDSVVVGSTNEVLKFLEWGTAPHTIEPDTADSLSWIDEATGNRVFAKKVEHPGTKPYAHLRSAIAKTRIEIQ